MNKEFFKLFFGAYPASRDVTARPSSILLKEAIDSRVKAITSKYDDVFLLWSGGIDSTLTFYALVHSGIKITVIYNGNSLLEYPKLGREILSGVYPNVTTLKTKDFTFEKRCSKPTITGELGDQMIGSATFVKYNKEQRNSDYKEILPAEIIHGFAPIVTKLLGKEELTAGEYLWALNFIFKYKEVTSRINTPSLFNGCDLVHFFESKEFESWALQNYSKNSSYDKYTEYKMAYKDYIFSQNGDEVYRKHKTKVPSLCMASKD